MWISRCSTLVLDAFLTHYSGACHLEERAQMIRRPLFVRDRMPQRGAVWLTMTWSFLSILNQDTLIVASTLTETPAPPESMYHNNNPFA